LLERGCIVGVQGLNEEQARPDTGRGARGARRYPDSLSNNASRRQSLFAGKIDFSKRPPLRTLSAGEIEGQPADLCRGLGRQQCRNDDRTNCASEAGKSRTRSRPSSEE